MKEAAVKVSTGMDAPNLFRVSVDFIVEDAAREFMETLQGQGHNPCLTHYTSKFVAKAAEIKARAEEEL
jgi:hypothetical protein